MARIHASIAERASEQLGLLRQCDLDELEVTIQQRRTICASGVLVREGPLVYRHVAVPPSHDQRLLAAVWVAGPGAALSHMAAASVWRFDGIDPGAVEVSVPYPRQPRSVRGAVHRVQDLVVADVTTRGLLRLTTPSRTLLDVAPRLKADQLEEALDGACRREQIYLPHLAWRLEELRHQGRPGVRRLAALLERPPRARNEESWLESAFLRLVRDGGLPTPRTQVTVAAGPGGRRYRLDATFEDQGVVAEVDGHATHATRRQRQADAERDAALVARGLRVVRFTAEDVVERPPYVVHTLALILGVEVPALAGELP